MEQANSCGKLAMVSHQVGEVKQLMHDNIELLLENREKMDDLDQKASSPELATPLQTHPHQPSRPIPVLPNTHYSRADDFLNPSFTHLPRFLRRE